MLQRPKTLGFVFLLTLLAALHVARSADAASVSRRCRRACRDQVAPGVGAGERDRMGLEGLPGGWGRVGVAVWQGKAGQFSAAGGGACSSPTVIPASGGTFSGATSGATSRASSLA